MSELLTIQEAADKAKVSTMTVRRAIKAQVLPSLRCGRAIRIAENEFEEYLRRERTRPLATQQAGKVVI